MAQKPAPLIYPGTKQPLKAEDLYPIFSKAASEQELNTTDSWIEIPEEVREMYRIWRPTPLVRATGLEKLLDTPAHIYIKNESVSPVGSHKLNSALAQAYYCKQEGVTNITTETGAGQWGAALSLAAKHFGLELAVYMVKISYNQKPYRRSIMQTYGAEVIASPSMSTKAGRKIITDNPTYQGSLGTAISEAVELAMSTPNCKYVLGSVLNHVALHQTVIGLEAEKQMAMAEEYPDVVIACFGGGSNFAGLAFPFLRHKLNGDISNNTELNRINLSRVKRIEVLDGAASTLYGPDAIGGVINIITDQPTDQSVSVGSDTRISGKGQFTEAVTLDIFSRGLGSYTSFTHDRADSYNISGLEYVKSSDTETQRTQAPLYTGYHSNVLGQKFTYSPSDKLGLNANIDYSYKITDRPNTNPNLKGGTDYEMRYKGLRWGAGGIYKFSPKNSLQADLTFDNFQYGREYDMETKSNKVGDFVRSKKQRMEDAEVKSILSLYDNSTTVIGANWRNEHLNASSGSIDKSVYSIAAYAQHEMRFDFGLTAVAGIRLTQHETFDTHLTPKLALMYNLGHFRLRASYSAGFRAPGLDELYYHYFSVNRDKPQIIFGNKHLDPEKSNYFALNAEYSNSWISVKATAFINSIDNMIVRKNIETDAEALEMLQGEFPEMTIDQAANLERYSIYQNSDKGNVKGLQLSLAANITPELSLNADYCYTYARTKGEGGWQTLERSVKNTATVAANYRHKVSKLYTFNINLNGRFQSKTYYPDFEDAPGFGIMSLNTIHTFNAVKWAKTELSLGIDNIFNKRDKRIDSTNRRYALFSPGRMIVAGLRLRF